MDSQEQDGNKHDFKDDINRRYRFKSKVNDIHPVLSELPIIEDAELIQEMLKNGMQVAIPKEKQYKI